MKGSMDSGLVGKVEKLEAENKKLKEENKRLDETLEDTLASLNFHQERNEELKQEKWELKDDILYYRMYVYSVDPFGDCSPEKEHVDSFTDDPEKRKTLYERIGYESDDDEDEQYMYDVRSEDRSITYYLGYDLDEARKHAGGRGLKILRYIVEDGEPNTDDWEIVE